MGYTIHHTIIVHSWKVEAIEVAHKMATDLGMRPSAIQPPDPNNSNVGFYIPPDGSKEGWQPSDDGDKARDVFVEWLIKQNTDEVGNYMDWVEVAFGGDEPELNTKIVRGKVKP
jgi:hypothetical protein